MRTSFLAFCSIAALACMAHSTLPVATQAQRQPAAPSSTRADSLKRFLQKYLKEPHSYFDETTRYFPAFVDLNGDGTQEVIVYVTGEGWCGTGGCTMLILARKDSSYRVITTVPATRPPIRVLEDTSNGWHSIAEWSVGGSPEPGYEAELCFDGKTYRYNRSVTPARQLTRKAAGKIVVPESQEGILQGMLLYP
jgi:hypothetical protein